MPIDLSACQARLDEIATWPANWDGFRAKKPNPMSIARAGEVIKLLYALYNLPEPLITPDGDGNIIMALCYVGDSSGCPPADLICVQQQGIHITAYRKDNTIQGIDCYL